jgi:uncharacterized membrane protein (DUF373 family)
MFGLFQRVVKVMIRILMVMMGIVLALSIVDLGWFIIKDVSAPPYLLLSVDQLLELFGLFMLVLIGIELLETIMKTYLNNDHPHVEVVLAVAIIAIARKVIVLDTKETDGLGLLGIAGIILALTAGYFLVKRTHLVQKAEQTD